MEVCCIFWGIFLRIYKNILLTRIFSSKIVVILLSVMYVSAHYIEVDFVKRSSI